MPDPTSPRSPESVVPAYRPTSPQIIPPLHPAKPAAPTTTSLTPTVSPEHPHAPSATSSAAPTSPVPPAPANSPAQPSQYQSTAIGTHTARQEDPFAEQNQRWTERQARERNQRKQVFIGIGITVACLVVIGVIGLAIWILTHQNRDPEDVAFWNDGSATEISDKAEELYNPRPTDDNMSTEGDTQAVTDYFEEQLSQATNDAERVNTILVEMRLYANNGRPDLVIESSKKVNVDMMTDFQLADYGSMLFNAYTETGDSDSANRYMQILEEHGAIGGEDGAG